MSSNKALSIPGTSKAEEYAIQVNGLTKTYRLYQKRSHRMLEALHPLGKIYHRKFFALRDVSFSVKKGEILGIVGRNGAGKSTLLQILSGVLEPSAGTVNVQGNITALLELGIGFNPELTGLENIYFHGTIKGKTQQEMNEILDDILAFAEIGDFISQPLKTYSSGMRARLGFALAAHMNPQILILDEVLAVGDELFKRKCYAKMEEVFNAGCTVLFVSHSFNSVNEICSQAILLDRGELILNGHPRLVTTYYQRLLFNESGQSDTVRQEIRELNLDPASKLAFTEDMRQVKSANGESGNTPEEIMVEMAKQRAFYVPGFKPTSTIVTRNCNVDIREPRIQNLSNETVNYLVTREDYLIKFRFSVHEAFDRVVLGLRLKTIRGTRLLTARLNPGQQQLRKLLPGDEVEVICRFSCNLLAGTYLVDLRAIQVGEDENKVMLIVADALIFKVQKTELSHRQGGIVFLNHNSKFIRKSQHSTAGIEKK